MNDTHGIRSAADLAIDREQLDLTERMPPPWDEREDELAHDAPAFDEPAFDAVSPDHRAPAPAAPRAMESRSPNVPARDTEKPRAAPPPIPMAARRPRASVPPPIPQRALAAKAAGTGVSVSLTAAPPAPTSANGFDVDIDVELAPPPAPVETPPLPAFHLAPTPARAETPPPAPVPPAPAFTFAPPVTHSADESELALPRPSQPSQPALPAARSVRRGTLPPPTRAATSRSFVVAPAPAAAPGPQVYPVVSTVPSVIARAPTEPQWPLSNARPALDRDDDPWFDEGRALDVHDADQPAWESTASLQRRVSEPVPWMKLGLTAVAVGCLSAMAAIALRDDTPSPARRPAPAVAASVAPAPASTEPARIEAPAPAVAEQPAEAPAPAVVEQPAVETPASVEAETPTPAVVEQPAVETPAPAVAEQQAVPIAAPTEPAEPTPTLRPVAIRTNPAGATVTLFADGGSSVLGETPLDIKLDATRSYDVVLTLPGYRTQLAKVDPRADTLEIALAAESAASAQPEARDEVAQEPEVAPAPPKKSKRASKRRATAAKPSRSKRVAASAKTTAKESRGTGTLMVSSKPPCEIVIDGVATVLNTPQRNIKLRPGKHKVTLFNMRHNIDATFEVTIERGKSTKLIRDFLARR